MLPIDSLLPLLQTTLATARNIVLQAPPGAGKTTRVPLALLNAAWLGTKKILLLEPRRLAARSAARFMAQSLNEAVGETVGYRVRMDSKIGPRTRIEVVTEGVLTRLLQADPELSDIGIVIFDEFHERSLQADLGLALCLDSQRGLREDLRLLVMSATLDGTAVAKLLGDAPLLTSEGRSYPVEKRYRPTRSHSSREYLAFYQDVARQVASAMREESGNALVFLPGSSEIRRVETNLKGLIDDPSILVAPLYGQLDAKIQDAAIGPTPPGKRKIVLATSIAETSLTIEGIRVVIDVGLSRVPRFDPNSGLTPLVTLQVAQASAEQRCGRAGRLEPGVCYRLWPEQTHLLPYSAPEILEADLAPLLLELALWGITEVTQLAFLDPPPPAHLAQAKELLQELTALDSDGRITPHGRAIAELAMHPRLAHMILRGKELQLGTLACELAALLGERDLLRGDAARSIDIHTRLDVLRHLHRSTDFDRATLQRIRDNVEQWRRQIRVPNAPADNADLASAGLLLSFAYPDRIAQRRSGTEQRFLLSNGRGAYIAKMESLGNYEYLVAANLDGATDARIYLAASVAYDELVNYHAEQITDSRLISWDTTQQAVMSTQQQCLGKLILREKPLTKPDPTDIANAMLTGIRQTGINCLPWENETRQLQQRLQLLHQLQPTQWPDYGDDALLVRAEQWLLPYLAGMTRLTHLKKLDLTTALLSPLSWEQQRQLKELAPTHITVPSGSHVRIDYSQTPPVLAVRLQELFGLLQTPRIANGQLPLMLHLLSPSRQPVQITQDLAGFWQRSYHDVKKELKGRYPKHFWPDDPSQAQPTARAKPRGT